MLALATEGRAVLRFGEKPILQKADPTVATVAVAAASRMVERHFKRG